MGLPITNISDFRVGRYALPQNQDSIKQLDAFIGEYENDLLDELLGCELASLFIADLDVDNVPASPRFVAIMDKFCQDMGLCRVQLKSLGIKEMLKGFVYFYYGRSLTDVLTTVGAKRASSGNSENTQQAATLLRKNYNLSVNTYKAIQEYICINSVDYPEFNGINKVHLTLI